MHLSRVDRTQTQELDGEKSVKFQSSKPYAQPFIRNGAPELDDKGKQMFGKYHKQFNLFHYEQTEPLTLS